MELPKRKAKRKAIRLPEYDYSSPGAYFVTICTHDRQCILSRITVGALKRLVNRRLGHDIWQRPFHEHIIRTEDDYREIWNYIDGNPAKWVEDCYYDP